MIRAGIDQFFKTTGQTGRVSVGFLANAVPLTGDNISPANSEIARFGILNLDVAQFYFNLAKKRLQRSVHVVDIFVTDTRHRQLLAGSEVNLSVAPGFGDVTRHR
ncbi:Uncharacterised protein [Salmonella enterica subsp. enterica serovar Bovismorbificans]|uniref:Uncharacterized protein n=1 Tax=Salmonella enterica subsp. enterica serovar Bovismorbificans TaxID=58097 RepID=A0A655DHI5_SALET|nr:Uncharacterised protein [Salmonella enterica subsp. enterica serovar Bovismorbificans]CNU67173.1 Uncharacterised protein [Salmonella enterica subsp. enterica serovar Bovismorbificans]CPR61511.1 Uncharacterised protein [Salmonella enterica subsp. enterica serovar Bovismorbificans]CQC27649.1 Uncharacterised protein [Salmonella enterica subsp. enterica serovar Typhimurium str. DT104]